MYHYIQDKNFLKHLKSTCCDIVNQLVQSVNNDSVMTVKACFVGSKIQHLYLQRKRGFSRRETKQHSKLILP